MLGPVPNPRLAGDGTTFPNRAPHNLGDQLKMLLAPLQLHLPALLSLVALTQGCISLRVPDDGYRLVWADEFDRAGAPGSVNWTYERGFVRNEEHQ